MGAVYHTAIRSHLHPAINVTQVIKSGLGTPKLNGGIWYHYVKQLLHSNLSLQNRLMLKADHVSGRFSKQFFIKHNITFN